MMIKLGTSGSYSGLISELRRFRLPGAAVLNRYGQEGVRALAKATPKESGKTAAGWSYKIVYKRTSVSLIWTNSNIVDGVPIAVILQHGHASRDGSWVEGTDYINPAMVPIFQKIADELWKEVIL